MEILHDILHVLLHSLGELALMLPILFLTYLGMEALEHHAREKTLSRISGAKKVGPLLGGALGIIPQCGVAGGAAASVPVSNQLLAQQVSSQESQASSRQVQFGRNADMPGAPGQSSQGGQSGQGGQSTDSGLSGQSGQSSQSTDSQSSQSNQSNQPSAPSGKGDARGFGKAVAAGDETAVSDVVSDAEVVSTSFFALSGARLSKLQRGVNIVVTTFADGSSVASRVIVK